MPVTLTEVTRLGGFGYRDVKVVDITFDASYASGGEVYDLDDVGLNSADVIAIENTDLTGNEYSFYVDRSAAKIMAFRADGTEATGDISAMVPRALVVGSRV